MVMCVVMMDVCVLVVWCVCGVCCDVVWCVMGDDVWCEVL